MALASPTRSTFSNLLSTESAVSSQRSFSARADPRSPRRVRIRMRPLQQRIQNGNTSHKSVNSNPGARAPLRLKRELTLTMPSNRYEAPPIDEEPEAEEANGDARTTRTEPLETLQNAQFKRQLPPRCNTLTITSDDGTIADDCRNEAQKSRRLKVFLRERKTSLTLAILTSAFMISWLPFFILAAVMPFCGDPCHTSVLLERLFRVFTWFGYANSAVNPIIYSIFNVDFRATFRKLLTGQPVRRSRHASALAMATVTPRSRRLVRSDAATVS